VACIEGERIGCRGSLTKRNIKCALSAGEMELVTRLHLNELGLGFISDLPETYSSAESCADIQKRVCSAGAELNKRESAVQARVGLPGARSDWMLISAVSNARCVETQAMFASHAEIANHFAEAGREALKKSEAASDPSQKREYIIQELSSYLGKRVTNSVSRAKSM